MQHCIRKVLSATSGNIHLPLSHKSHYNPMAVYSEFLVYSYLYRQLLFSLSLHVSHGCAMSVEGKIDTS